MNPLLLPQPHALLLTQPSPLATTAPSFLDFTFGSNTQVVYPEVNCLAE